jgi:hypothetical protein
MRDDCKIVQIMLYFGFLKLHSFLNFKFTYLKYRQNFENFSVFSEIFMEFFMFMSLSYSSGKSFKDCPGFNVIITRLHKGLEPLIKPTRRLFLGGICVLTELTLTLKTVSIIFFI